MSLLLLFNGNKPTVVTPGTASVTVTGYAPTVSTPQTRTPGTGALTATGLAPTVLLPRTARPGVGAAIVAGLAPTVLLPQTLRPGVGSVVATGFAPTVTVTAAGGPALAQPGTGSVVATGYAPDVLIPGDALTRHGGIVFERRPLTRQRQRTLHIFALETYAPTVIVAPVFRAAPAQPAPTPVVVTPGTGIVVAVGIAPRVVVEAPAPVAATTPAAPLRRPVAQPAARPALDRKDAGSTPARAIPLPAPRTVAPEAGALLIEGWAPTVIAEGRAPERPASLAFEPPVPWTPAQQQDMAAILAGFLAMVDR